MGLTKTVVPGFSKFVAQRLVCRFKVICRLILIEENAAFGIIFNSKFEKNN